MGVRHPRVTKLFLIMRKIKVLYYSYKRPPHCQREDKAYDYQDSNWYSTLQLLIDSETPCTVEYQVRCTVVRHEERTGRDSHGGEESRYVGVEAHGICNGKTYGNKNSDHCVHSRKYNMHENNHGKPEKHQLEETHAADNTGVDNEVINEPLESAGAVNNTRKAHREAQPNKLRPRNPIRDILVCADTYFGEKQGDGHEESYIVGANTVDFFCYPEKYGQRGYN